MQGREIRVSPDGNSVAIRSDADENHWNAWGVMSAQNGGHWSTTSELADWITVEPIEVEDEPEEPEEPETPPAP